MRRNEVITLDPIAKYMQQEYHSRLVCDYYKAPGGACGVSYSNESSVPSATTQSPLPHNPPAEFIQGFRQADLDQLRTVLVRREAAQTASRMRCQRSREE